MEVQLNTLYVATRRATVRRDHLTLRVEVEKQTRLTVPVHQLEGVVAFGGVHVTPSAMALCAEQGVAVSFLTESGRLLCRVDAPARERPGAAGAVPAGGRRRPPAATWAGPSWPGRSRTAGRCCCGPAGSRPSGRTRTALRAAADRLADALPALGAAGRRGLRPRARGGRGPGLLRGVRVDGPRRRDAFAPARPDPAAAAGPDERAAVVPVRPAPGTTVTAAATAAGLDPSVGFLHVDRPGRPGLALDLMEEFRPLLADRLALALVNRQQVKPEGFEVRDGGAVRDGRRDAAGGGVGVPDAEEGGGDPPPDGTEDADRPAAVRPGAGVSRGTCGGNCRRTSRAYYEVEGGRSLDREAEGGLNEP